MLILDTSQVRYHRVVLRPMDKPLPTPPLKLLPGLVYKHKLYRLVEAYSSSKTDHRREHAIQTAREIYHQTGGEHSILVVEAPQQCSVWIQDSALILWRHYKIRHSLLNSIQLSDLANWMQGSNGVEIRDRHHRLRRYSHSFLGHEAVHWFQQNFGLSESDAIQLGQRLVNQNWIYPVLAGQRFQNKPQLYRFYHHGDQHLPEREIFPRPSIQIDGKETTQINPADLKSAHLKPAVI